MITTVTLAPALDKTIRISNFTAGNVNRVEAVQFDAGGKGINVSKNLSAWGVDARACGILGGANGTKIQALLEKDQIVHDFVYTDGDTRINIKITDPVNRVTTDINESAAAVSDEVLKAVFDRVASRLGQGDVVVLAGRVPGGVSSRIYADWIAALKRLGIEVFLDAEGELLSQGAKEKPALIKANKKEFEDMLGYKVADEKEMIFAARNAVRQGIKTLVVSLGEQGAMFFNEKESYLAPALRVQVNSTVGAGDAMMAAMCFGTAKGLSFLETCKFAMAASAAAIMQTGTQAVGRKKVENLLDEVRLEKIN